MTEDEISSLLIDSFQKQIFLYRELEVLNRNCERVFCTTKNSQELLPLIKQKKEKIDKITGINLSVEQAKGEWKENKAQWTKTDLKRQVEDCLAELTGQISKTIATEKRLEKLLQEPTQNVRQAAAGKYKSQGM